MSPRRRLTTTKVRGVASGTAFDGTPAPTALDTAAISRIYVHFGDHITALEVHYDNSSVGSITHGTVSGNKQEVNLHPYELITTIEGSWQGGMINHLTFTTTRRTFGPFGERKGEFFQWDGGAKVPSEIAPCMGLLAFRGTCSAHITSLQATFAEFAPHPHSTVKFEKLRTLANAKSPNGVASLPSYAVHLMSPVITLFAGPEPIELHVHEYILCRLPFFRAALYGDFKEATEQVVKMPEDDATSVAALVEFLSSGGYTYAYNPDNTRFRDGKSIVPIADLAQGLFHVSVYATASKYDCPKLVDEAINNFGVVLVGLEGIDILRLWQAAYAVGLTMSAWGTGEGPTKFNDGLMKWGPMLAGKHREEMEKILSDFPALACDLLGFSKTGVDKESSDQLGASGAISAIYPGSS